MKRTQALALGILATSLLTACGEPTQHPNDVIATQGFDTIRHIQLPAGRTAYVLRDRVSGTCLLMSVIGDSTGGSVLQIVPDNMCGVTP